MFEEWEAGGSVVRYLNLNKANAYGALVDSYGIPGHKVIRAVISHAIGLGAQSVAIEYRYIDADYRDEHAKFWSSTFRRYPSVAHRLHFFADSVAELKAQVSPFHFQKFTYLGYVVMRPVPPAPVGRTMLPPPWLEDGSSPMVLCLANDSVNLLGSHLEVRGMPFYSQDAQLTRCGQAVMLATGYYYHLVFGEPRMLPGGVVQAASVNSGELGRPVPSPGVTLEQLVDTATVMRVPPVVYPVASLTEDIEAVICRYLNSKFPVTVFARHHAFLLVGYRIVVEADGSHTVRFLRHDDEVGPYQWIGRDEVDDYGDWDYLIVPLPPKIYMVAERAEAVGEAQFKKVLEAGSMEDRELLSRWNKGEVAVRTAAVTSNDFKRRLVSRKYPASVVVRYQAMRMSRYIWVVEILDKKARNAGKRCVLAEVLIDATDHPSAPRLLAWRVPSGLGWTMTDTPDESFSNDYAMSKRVHSVVQHVFPHTRPF